MEFKVHRNIKFISREKEYELINRLLTIVDNRTFDPGDTAILMVSPDYSATVAMHLCHAWSKAGNIIKPIAVDVPFPDEQSNIFKTKLLSQQQEIKQYKKLVLVEAGIIRGSNWKWIVETLINDMGYTRDQLTLVALCENYGSITKSDYVGEYYDDDIEDLTFYYERYNKHWPVKKMLIV